MVIRERVRKLLIPGPSTFSDNKRWHFSLGKVHLFDILVLISYKKTYSLVFVYCGCLLMDLNVASSQCNVVYFSLLNIWANFTFSDTKL